MIRSRSKYVHCNHPFCHLDWNGLLDYRMHPSMTTVVFGYGVRDDPFVLLQEETPEHQQNPHFRRIWTSEYAKIRQEHNTCVILLRLFICIGQITPLLSSTCGWAKGIAIWSVCTSVCMCVLRTVLNMDILHLFHSEHYDVIFDIRYFYQSW